MSCIQVTACRLACSPLAFPARDFQVNKSSRYPSAYLGTKLSKISLKLTSPTSGYQFAAPVCLFGGKGKSENENEASPWKTLEKAMGNFKKDQSIEDVLKQQIQKQEYYDDGGGGGKRPGGGGGSGDSSGEADKEGLSGIFDEFVQVIFATIALVFLYIYIIEGEELTVLAKDFIKFLFTRQMSLRLTRIVDQWKSFSQGMMEQEESDPYWLERAIINTPTMYDSPDKYRRIIYKAYLEAKSDHEGNQNFG